MEYNKIIAVTGLPGLYELLSSKSDGAIVRSLDDKSTRFVASRVHNFSHLESIEVYTVRENVNLVDILLAMDSSSEKLPQDKDNGALKAYFSKVFPDLDFERVYASDLKKMVKWFIILKENKIEIKLTEAPAEEETEAEEPVAETPAAPAAKKKTAAKEDAPAKIAKVADASAEEAAAEEKPKAKKPAAKKKTTPDTEKSEEAPAEKPKKAAKKKND
jgi:uncharacterized protein DUF6852/uncharacterized protein DUF5606